jgi:hypothetical protein
LTITFAKKQTFNGLATYSVDLNSTLVRSDQVAARGVTGDNGATVTIRDLGTRVIVSGIVFTVINNTAATRIADTFT